MPVKRNQNLTLQAEADRYGGRGEGVATVDGVTVWVAGAAPGDVVDVVVEHVSPHRPEAWARVERAQARGEAFQGAPCEHAAPTRGRCGGCPLMHLTPAAQRRFKLDRVRAALDGLEADVTFTPAPRTEGYRNRGNFVVARRGAERVLGSYAPRSHDVVSMAGCRVNDPRIDDVARALRRHLEGEDVPVHPAPGGLRYVTARAVEVGVLVELVIGADAPPPWLDACARVLMESPHVIGVTRSHNTSRGNALHVAPPEPVAGVEAVAVAFGPVTVEISASAFLQLNTAVAARMYARAAERLGDALADAPVLWDLYCGAGALGLTALHHHPHARLFGAEVHAGAVERARDAARRAHVDHAHFAAARLDLAGDLDELRARWPSPDAVLVNPPRRGLDAPVLDALTGDALDARALIYMSCNPESFARDAAALTRSGWRLEGAVEAHDMLPHTPHVELLSGWKRG